MTPPQWARVLFSLIVGGLAYGLYRLTVAAPVAGVSIAIALVVLLVYARNRWES